MFTYSYVYVCVFFAFAFNARCNVDTSSFHLFFLLLSLSTIHWHDSSDIVVVSLVFLAIMLTSYLRKRVSVITTDGRNLIGVLHSADQVLNVVLTSCIERVLAPHDADKPQPVEEVQLGVLMIRGSDVVSVALIDVYEEARTDATQWTGRDMPPAKIVPRSTRKLNLS